MYDAQKDVCEDAVEEFCKQLEQEGFYVTKYTTHQSGSGDWRYTAELLAEKGALSEKCFMEMLGSISHDLSNEPDWWRIRPLRITCHGEALDDRCTAFVAQRFREKKWEVEIEQRGAK